MFIAPRLGLRDATGHWEARRQVGQQIEVMERSVQFAPMLLPMKAGQMHTLQDYIHDWHQSDAVRAFTSLSLLIALQLPRFHPETGQKLYDEALIEEEIQVPAFTDEGIGTVRWVPFRLTSLVCHAGARPTSGHYQAVLRAPAEGLGLACSAEQSCQFWLTDDGKSAVKVAGVQPNNHIPETYLLLYVAGCGF